MLRWAQTITGRVNTTLSFWLITLVYVILGLMEVDDLRRKAQAFVAPEAARMLLSATADTARKFRKYMRRTNADEPRDRPPRRPLRLGRGASFASEWGVIAFALNYIPFIGPFVATLIPDPARDGAIRVVAGGSRRFRLPQYHPVCYRQLCRAARIGQRALDLALGRAIRRLLLDLSLGPVRRLHRRADRDRRADVLRPLSVDPMDRRASRRPGPGNCVEPD